MVSTKFSLGLALLLMTSVAFAGCGGSNSGGSSPSTGTSGTGNTTGSPTPTTGGPVAVKWVNQTAKYQANTAPNPNFSGFTLDVNYTKLEATLSFYGTAACAVVAEEAAGGGTVTKKITIAAPSPSTVKIEFVGEIPGPPGTCSTSPTPWKWTAQGIGGMKDAATPPKGAWTITSAGLRGQNLDAKLEIKAS